MYEGDDLGILNILNNGRTDIVQNPIVSTVAKRWCNILNEFKVVIKIDTREAI